MNVPAGTTLCGWLPRPIAFSNFKIVAADIRESLKVPVKPTRSRRAAISAACRDTIALSNTNSSWTVSCTTPSFDVAKSRARSAANAKRPIRSLDLVGPVVLRAGSKSEGAAGRFHSNAPDRFVWVVDELIKPNARFWTYAEIGVVVKSQTRQTTVSGANQLLQ
jgi:hypothetical protein